MADSVTAALTAVFGVAVFVAGQTVQRFVLEPVQEQRKILGEIAHAVLMYGNVDHVADIRARNLPVSWSVEPEQVVRDVRGLAARLQATLYLIPAYQFLAFLHIVPPKRQILEAIKGLTGWSNSIYSGGATLARDGVVRALKIPRSE
jgi:hypothetical protein